MHLQFLRFYDASKVRQFARVFVKRFNNDLYWTNFGFISPMGSCIYTLDSR